MRNLAVLIIRAKTLLKHPLIYSAVDELDSPYTIKVYLILDEIGCISVAF